MGKYFRHPELPKANLITIRRSFVRCWFWRGYTVRNANARQFYWLGLSIIIRRPWLKHSARALYPDIFKDELGNKS